MVNINKLLFILEELKFGADSDAAAEEQLGHNLATLKKFIKKEPCKLLEELSSSLKISLNLKTTTDNVSYVLYLAHALNAVIDNVNFDSTAKEDLLATKHVNLCIEAVQHLSYYAMRRFLFVGFCKFGVYAQLPGSGVDCNPELLQLSVELFGKLLKIRQLHMANAMETTIRDYIAAIYSLFAAFYGGELSMDDKRLGQLQSHLDAVWLGISKLEFFRNLMLLKGIPHLPQALQRKLHQELLQKLASKDGFTSLIATLQLAATQREQDYNEKQTFELIAKIVAFPGHSRRFQEQMLQQIWHFLRICLLNDAMLSSMGAGLLSLRRLYDANVENQRKLREMLSEELSGLIEPKDLLAGLIQLEHREFSLLLSLLYHLFCTSTVECLPSELLLPYMPLLLQLYYGIPPGFTQKQQLGGCITRCLHQLDELKLAEAITTLYNNEGNSLNTNWLHLHPRLILIPNQQQSELNIKVAHSDYKPDMSISLALPELLMSHNFHQLTYRIFMLLLNLLMHHLSKSSSEATLDLLESEEDLLAFLNSRYPVKVEILLSLNTLISHQPLKTQLREHAKEFLEFLQQTIERRLKSDSKKGADSSNQEAQDQTLVLLLTLTQEVLSTHAMLETYSHFIPKLQALRKCTPNQLVQQRISSLIALLSGSQSLPDEADATPFNTARSLLESSESHLQVYGIQMLLDLLRRRDMHTMSNCHVILALALTTLRDKESYTFLNTVRLVVALVNVMEAEVLELLADEYLNERNAMDFRLVVGEAILKVSQELGPLCYKYKGVLLNCFMSGCRSPLPEYRMSAFANLAQLCRTLSYEVQAFFQELLQLIESELSTGSYVPAKRAAVLVLTELLAGMPNLVDFGDMLLPIYRLLKLIVASENCDEKMRLHAAKGLSILAEKCKELLFPEQNLQKEIKILGVKDEGVGSSGSGKRGKHILEIN